MRIDCPRIVVSGTHSGVCKTSIALALVASLSRCGIRVRPFREIGALTVETDHV